jgi:hypothetical protein
VTRRGDEVQERMHTVIPEARVTLDTRLLSQNVVVLTLEVANDFLEAKTKRYSVRYVGMVIYERKLIVDVVPETRSVNNGKGNANTILLQFCDNALNKM